MVEDGDGRLYASGIVVTNGNEHQRHVFVWEDGRWVTLGDGLPGGHGSAVYDLLIGNDGHLYVAGHGLIAGTSQGYVLKRTGDTWLTLAIANGPVMTLAMTSGGLLYAGGNFTVIGGQNSTRVAVWDGETWATVGFNVNSTVQVLAVG
ncbi:hypothetical protein BH23BAC4_BH23BAC4_11780 [soil metagenome]